VNTLDEFNLARREPTPLATLGGDVYQDAVGVLDGVQPFEAERFRLRESESLSSSRRERAASTAALARFNTSVYRSGTLIVFSAQVWPTTQAAPLVWR
jgi:hypothetical protein